MKQPDSNNDSSPQQPQGSGGFWQSLGPTIVAMARYFRANVGELWWYAVEVTPALERTGDRAREIRISKDDAVGAAAFDGHDWRLEFPDCCVVTGEPADGPWIERTETLPNVAWPFWGTVAGVCGGLFFSLLIWKWLWPFLLLAGMMVGFANRQTRQVQLRYRKSRNAADDDEYPQVWLLPDGLLVRLGSSVAKKAFVQYRVDRQEADRNAAVTIAPRRDTATLKLDETDSDRPSGQPSPTAPRVTPPTREDLPPIRLDDE